MLEIVIKVIKVAAHVVELVGIGVIFWGVGVCVVGFVAAQLHRSNGSLLHAIAKTHRARHGRATTLLALLAAKK